MILQSEAQFLDSYGRRSERRMRHSANNEGDGSLWDKLSRIFSFGCIETSHNNNNTTRWEACEWQLLNRAIVNEHAVRI